jgi:hypothetical protein
MLALKNVFVILGKYFFLGDFLGDLDNNDITLLYVTVGDIDSFLCFGNYCS